MMHEKQHLSANSAMASSWRTNSRTPLPSLLCNQPTFAWSTSEKQTLRCCVGVLNLRRPPIMVFRSTTMRLGPGEIAPRVNTAPAAKSTSQAMASMHRPSGQRIQPWPCASKKVEGDAATGLALLLGRRKFKAPTQHRSVCFSLVDHAKVG